MAAPSGDQTAAAMRVGTNVLTINAADAQGATRAAAATLQAFAVGIDYQVDGAVAFLYGGARTTTQVEVF